MKVKCIDDTNLIEPRDGKLLTIGKEYDIIEFETDGGRRIYWIIDDTEWKRFYDADRFSPSFEELREIRINEILK
jgi:hypothetical protein